MATNEKISLLVSSQLPDYISGNYPLFVSFLEAYYEWTEKTDNAIDATKNLLAYQDIDTTLDKFFLAFKKEFMSILPNNMFVDERTGVATDKRKVLKHIKEFYLAKGTEKSYKLLFNILYNSPCEFYYPWTDILRVSDGKWVQDMSLRVYGTNGDVFSFEGVKIIQEVTNATALVKRITKSYVSGHECYDLFLDRETVSGTFVPRNIIKDIDGNSGIVARARPYPVIQRIIMNPSHRGSNYLVGEDVVVTPVGGNGVGALIKINKVDASTGGILGFKILNHGLNYDIAPTISFDSDMGVGAQATSDIGALITHDGYYLNEDGQLDTLKCLQDGYFYQQFSYVTIVERSFNEYRSILKKILHPAGWKLFGKARTFSIAQSPLSVPTIEDSRIRRIDVIDHGNGYTNVQTNGDFHIQGVFNNFAKIQSPERQERPFFIQNIDSTKTRVTLDSASALDGAYNGCTLHMLSGNNNDAHVTITSYVGATKIATLESALSGTKISDQYEIVFNAQSFGAFNVVDANREIVLSSGSSVADYYVGMTLKITSGAAAGQQRGILKYVGSSKTLTSLNYIEGVAAGDTCEIWALGELVESFNIVNVNSSVNILTLDLSGPANDSYNGCVLFITSGDATGEFRTITDYDGATKKATLSSAISGVRPSNIPYGGSYDGDLYKIEYPVASTYGEENILTIDNPTGFTTDAFAYCTLYMLSGIAKGQQRRIINYNQITKQIILEETITGVQIGDLYEILPTIEFNGDGFFAGAKVTIVDDYIDSAAITNPGYGYNEISATIVGGTTGTPATFKVYLSRDVGPAPYVTLLRQQYSPFSTLLPGQQYALDVRAKSENSQFLETLVITVKQSGEVVRLGPSLRSINRDKFWYKPNSYGNEEIQMLGPNAAYWDTHANCQIEYYKDWIISDFDEENFWKRMPNMPEPALLNRNVAKTYSSVSALVADTNPTGINLGEYAVITTANPDDPDNNKAYLWMYDDVQHKNVYSLR
jgi:hypothetical protein